jgi:hypothetical protein
LELKIGVVQYLGDHEGQLFAVNVAVTCFIEIGEECAVLREGYTTYFGARFEVEDRGAHS